MKNPEIRFKDDNIDWQERTLGDIGTLKNGYSFKSNLYTEDGAFNVITISNVQGHRHIVINDTTNKYPAIPHDISIHQMLKENDILVSLTGNVGRVSLNKGKNNLLNQRVGLFDTQDTSVDRLFAFELMHSKDFENTMLLQGQGAAQLNISKGDVEGYKVKIPTLSVQKEIAALLSDIDQKISSQESLIQKLKDTKSALLIKMFPQENQSIPEIRFAGFSYPWEQRKLGNITSKIGSGKTPQGGSTVYKNDGVPLIRSQNIFNDTIDLFEVAYIDIKTDNDMANSRVHKNDVLINITGASIGRSAVYRFANNANVNQHVCIIRPNKEFNPDFIQLQLTSNNGQTQIEESQVGGGREGLNFQAISKFIFLYPNRIEQDKISQLLLTLNSLLTLHQRKLDKLKEVKAALLDKLLV